MSFDFNCPVCGTTLSAEDGQENSQVICSKCQNSITAQRTAAAPADAEIAQPEVCDCSISIAQLAPDRFVFRGDLQLAWQYVIQAMSDCEVTINEQNFGMKNIVGNRKYGINPFGITVNAYFYQAGQPDFIMLDFKANLSDAFDTLGVCRRICSQLGEKFMFYCRQNGAGMLQQIPDIQLNNNIPQGMPNGMNNNIPQGMPNGMNNNLPQGMPNGMNNNMPQGMPNGMNSNLPQGMPNGMNNNIPQGMPNGMNSNMPQGMPNGQPYNGYNGGSNQYNQYNQYNQFNQYNSGFNGRQYKNPGIAALLSFFVVGAGQMYNKQIAKGIIALLACMLLYFILGVFAWILTIPAWIVCIIDANKIAEKINQGIPVGDWDWFWMNNNNNNNFRNY